MNEITDVADIYSREYHAIAGERGEKQWPAKQDMAHALHDLVAPRTVIDVGCGRGWWMEYWVREQPGVEIVGLDGCAELIKANGQYDRSVTPLIHSCDLRKVNWQWRWRMGPKGALPDYYDLVLCVEVGEHLEERYAERLVRGLSRLGHGASTIFFSAARPGQKGVCHVNCQEKRWWIELFKDHRFALRMELWRAWHDRLVYRGKVYGRNIRRNAMFFTREPNRQRRS